MPSKGLRLQVLGAMLIGLGVITALLSRIIGFELAIFYPVISILGVGLFAYGHITRKNS
jgi:hypothetical protein